MTTLVETLDAIVEIVHAEMLANLYSTIFIPTFTKDFQTLVVEAIRGSAITLSNLEIPLRKTLKPYGRYILRGDQGFQIFLPVGRLPTGMGISLIVIPDDLSFLPKKKFVEIETGVAFAEAIKARIARYPLPD